MKDLKIPHCKSCVHCKIRVPVGADGLIEYGKTRLVYCAKNKWPTVRLSVLNRDTKYRIEATRCDQFEYDMDAETIRLFPSYSPKERKILIDK